MAGNDRSLGELFGRLLDDGKAYGLAEVELARLKLERAALSYRSAAIFLAVAVALGIAASTALTFTLVLWLGSLLGPLGGGLLATGLIAAGAAGCAFLAKRRFEAADGE